MIGKKLRSLRKAKSGLSQAALADALGVTQQAVGNWETDKNMPDHDIQIKIADYFHITLDELNGRETSKGYYVNEETAEIANALKEGDGMLRVLFDAARDLPPEKMKEAASYIQYLKAQQHPEDD